MRKPPVGRQASVQHSEQPSSRVSRRSVLKATAAGSSTALLAGCLGTLGGGDTITIGGNMALSGPFGASGQLAEKSIELALELADEHGDTGGRDVEIEIRDTQADPATGRRNAQEFVNEGVDILFGSLSSAVAGPVSEVAQQNGLIYISMGGDPAFTGANCRPMHFVAGNNPFNQANAAARYAYDQDPGERLYTVTSNFAWGQSHLAAQTDTLAPEFGLDHVGNTFTDFGQGDYSQAVTEAQNADPDVVYFAQYGADHVQTANQAAEFGLLDEAVCVWPLTGIDAAVQIDADVLSHDNFISGLWWYGGDDAPPDAQEYLDAHFEMFDERPNATGAVMYSGMRTLLNAVGDAGTTDGEAVREQLEGREYDVQIWGVGERFRACDHSGIYPTMVVTGQDDVVGQDYFEVLSVPENPEQEQYLPCEETGCQF